MDPTQWAAALELQGGIVTVQSPEVDLATAIPPGAIGFLQYRSLPGIRFEQILQEAIALHCRGVEDPQEFVGQASAILDFVTANGQTESYRHFAAAELQRLSKLEGDDLMQALAPPPGDRAYHQHEIEALARASGLSCAFEPGAIFSPRTSVLLYRDSQQAPAPPPVREDNAIYHQVNYPSYLHPQLHPDRLAAMAWVFGMQPAEPRYCRYLELGCGTAHSLLAFAADFPEARFTGIDFSQAMIDEGLAAATDLGIRNIDLKAADILDASFPQPGETFDYIVMHGMLSWTPEPVRARMLQICRDHLSPNGVAYVSCNSLPGYLLPAILRDLGHRVDRPVQCPADSERVVSEIRALPLDTLTPERRTLLEPALDNFCKADPTQVMFDELADINVPFRFGELCQLAADYGLRYVTEAGIDNWTARTLSPAAQNLLQQLADDPALRMQYRDMLRLTRFHASIFCREESQHTPEFSPMQDRALRLWVSTRAFPLSKAPVIRDPSPETFEAPDGAAVTLKEPLLKSVLYILHQRRPARLRVPELLRAACEATGVLDFESAKARFAELILPFWEAGLIDLFWHMPELAAEPTDAPLLSPFARSCAAVGSRTLPSLLGCACFLDSEEDRLLALALDGTKDRAALCATFGLDPEALDRKLREFARMGLLLR